MSQRQLDGVTLPSGVPASALLHRLLSETVARFPSLAAAAPPASAESFRKGFPAAIERFEAERAASTERAQAAAFLVEASHRALEVVSGGQVTPLDEAVRGPAEPCALESWRLTGSGRLQADAVAA